MSKSLDFLAQNVRALRHSLKLSQEDLAGNANVGHRSLQELESRKKDPRLSTIEKLAIALKVYPSELIKGPAQKESEIVEAKKMAMIEEMESLKKMVVDQFTSKYQPPEPKAPNSRRSSEIEKLSSLLAALNDSEFSVISKLIQNRVAKQNVGSSGIKSVKRRIS